MNNRVSTDNAVIHRDSLTNENTMSLTTLAPLIAKGETLLSHSPCLHTDTIIRLCRDGLGYLAREAQAYAGKLILSEPVLGHFKEELDCLIGSLDPGHFRANALAGFAHIGDVQGCAFCLLEDMALFIREKNLREGRPDCHGVEKEIMAFFENSGNWPKDGKALVTDMYYNKLPSAVSH